MRRGFVRHMLPLRSFRQRVFIRHLRMLRGTLLSGRSSSGTCARFRAHSSADPYCRESQSGVWLPRQSTFSEREADAVAEAGDGRGVSRHPACGIARVRPKNAGNMPLRRSARSRRQRVRSRLVCLVAKPRISARTDVAQRNRMGSTPERRCGRMPCQGFEAAKGYAAERNPREPGNQHSLAAVLFCAFIPHPPPFPPRSIPTTSRGQLFRTDFSYPPRSTPPGMCGSTERRRRPVRDAIPPASPSTPQSDGKGRPHRTGMINRPRVREALHTQTDEPAPGKGGSK